MEELKKVEEIQRMLMFPQSHPTLNPLSCSTSPNSQCFLVHFLQFLREPRGKLSIWDKCSLISQLLPKISASLLGQEQGVVQPGKVINPSAPEMANVSRPSNNNNNNNNLVLSSLRCGTTSRPSKKHKKNKCKDDEVMRGYTFPDHLVADLCPPSGTGDVPSLLSHLIRALLRDDNPEVQAEAAYALACYCCAPDNSDNTNIVVKYQGVSNAVKLLRWSPCANVREQVLWLLVNITGDSLASRDAVLLERAVLMQLLAVILTERGNVKVLRPATMVLFNILSYKPQPPLQKMRAVFEALCRLIQYNDDEVILTNACWAIEHLCDDSDDKFQGLIQADITSKLARLFTSPSSTVQLSALRTFRCIVRKNSQTQPIIDGHLLALFTPLLTEKHKKKVKAEVCRIISYIPGGSVEHVQALIDAGITVALINLFLHKELEIKVETVQAIGNATLGANSDQIKFLMEHKYIDVLRGLLDGGDPNITLLCIGLVENILKALLILLKKETCMPRR